MSDGTEYRYDIFISYSHQDKIWVNEQLLPRLEGAGLRVCIDARDFAIGVPSLINMERAVDSSRHTLVVLTPAWVASEWTEFESLLVGTSDPAGRRQRVIPLMLKQCEPPLRITMLTWADFREPQQHEMQFNRLISQLRTKPATLSLNADLSDVLSATSRQDRSNQATKVAPQTSQGELRNTEKPSIQTTGGARIEGDVTTGGGDLIGRDETVHGDKVGGDKIIHNYFINHLMPGQSDPQTIITPGEQSQIVGPQNQSSSNTKQAKQPIELPHGTVPPTSTFYMNRQADRECQDYFNPSRPVTLYVKAPRQMGKSSLMQRTDYLTKRTAKFEIAYIDCEKFTTEQLQNLDEFLIELCYMVSEALDIPEAIEKYWSSTRRSSLIKCSNYIAKHIVSTLNKPLILAMDEVERVLDAPFRNDFFGMLRTWHNDRAHDANMAKVSLFLSSSTEPQLFIDNPNQSPFNVAQPIVLDDFIYTEVQQLNQRHPNPLADSQIVELMNLLGGHPFLTRLALYLTATQQYDFARLLRTVTAEDSPFASHLDHFWRTIAELPELRQALIQIIRHQTYPADKLYYRLKGAGLVKRVEGRVMMRNQLYERYFAGRLHV